MNIVGFLKRHDEKTDCAIDSYNSNSLLYSEHQINEIVSYLEKGSTIAAFTMSLYDVDGEYIAPYIIYSDGCWIWPSYYSFYIKKYKNIEVPKEFISDIFKNKSQEAKLSREDKMYAEYFLIQLLKIKMQKDWKPLPELQRIIDVRGNDIKCY